MADDFELMIFKCDGCGEVEVDWNDITASQHVVWEKVNQTKERTAAKAVVCGIWFKKGKFVDLPTLHN